VIIQGAVRDITVEVVRRTPADEGKGFVPQPKRWVIEQVNGTLMLHRRLARDYDHRPDNRRLPRLLGRHRRHAPASHRPQPRLARRDGAGRVNISELLRLLQAEHDEAAARTDRLRERIEQVTTALAETEARLAELIATRKVIDGLAPPDHAPTVADPATATVYQRIVTAFNEQPERCSASAIHTSNSACPPTSPRSTSLAPAWDDSSARDSSSNPDAANTRNGCNTAFSGPAPARSTTATLA
jgi:hypothetical protein